MQIQKKLTKKSRILVATFSPWKNGKRLPTNGMVEPFIRYFSRKFDNFTLIDQPHPGSDILMPKIEIYKIKKLKKITTNSFWLNYLKPLLTLTNVHKTQISFKLRDFLSVIDYVIDSKVKYDLFIGFESVNALAGIVMKKFGRIKKVVYYVSDFSPKRYHTRWFNRLYLWLDKLATAYADATWNVSPAMAKARKKLGYNMEKISPQIYAPNAFFPEEIKYNSPDKILPQSLIYAGTLGEENGPDIVIRAIPYILKKFPKATLTIAGGGSEKDVKKIKDLIKMLKLSKNIKFVGFIPTNKELLEIVRKHSVSVAPYRNVPGSVRKYADAVKIRMSMACGLPVVTTKVPPNGKLAKEVGAGVVVKDNPNDIAKAVIKIFSNADLYRKMRLNAIKAAKKNTWENSYSTALRKMHLIK